MTAYYYSFDNLLDIYYNKFIQSKKYEFMQKGDIKNGKRYLSSEEGTDYSSSK